MCLIAYVSFEIQEGAYEISCPDANCEKQGVLTLAEIEALVPKSLVDKHAKFRLYREIEKDGQLTWCPSPGCETVCRIQEGAEKDLSGVRRSTITCTTCSKTFCADCKLNSHPDISCESHRRKLVKQGKLVVDESEIYSIKSIKKCPFCHVPIEKDSGCAQMMCKRCKHVFCWYCLTSLDDDFLLRHYDKGPCKNKLGHSRASVVWHRAQVIGIFAGFGILVLLASPLLILAAPCLLCCRCGYCANKLDPKDPVQLDGSDFDEWLGIPYGKPPVGELRFQSPQPAEKWEGVRDGSNYGAQCPQPSMISFDGSSYNGDEDCLSLNVHSPKITLQKLLPVMVWIHGGAFQFGSSSEYRPIFFMDEDVVVVTINYRLNAFGFLNIGDKNIRGNMGLKDQVLALKWVKQNIEAFGGDSNKITVFGESAGGVSTHYLLLSPSTKGLFHKAISQSGVASQPWGSDTTEVAKKYTEKFAAELNCPTGNSAELIQCLREKSVDDLINAANIEIKKENMVNPHKDGHWFRPSVEAIDDEEAFLTQHPLDAVKEHKFHRIPWMSGVNAHEGLITSLGFHKSEAAMQAYEENWTENVLRTFNVPKDTPDAETKAAKIRNLYFPKTAEPLTKEQKLEKYTQLFSDSFFNHHASYSYWVQKPYMPVYLYYYNRHGGPSMAPLIAGLQDRFPVLIEFGIFIAKSIFNSILGTKKDYGVCHADDIAMLFIMNGIFDVQKDDSADYKFSKDMVKLWAQFATDDEKMEFRGVKWTKQKHTPGRLHYFELSETPKVIQEPFEERVETLTSILKW
ncbi:unnamed protein product [Allacma fusca]|uniref:RING-type domain-containing protein n=1 Tax=Allacma fusca TaxID=39272 RepID=A0A8J2LMD9_9HEXA|nr:unnamed protein product [Allacma fusca]